MILIAVIVGYILGIAPFLYKEIREMLEEKNERNENKKEEDKTAQILDEWLNGVKEPVIPNKKNQEDIYQEYVTGKEVTKGE